MQKFIGCEEFCRKKTSKALKARQAYNKLVNKKEEDDDINDILRGLFGREFPKRQKSFVEDSIQYNDTEQFIEDKNIVDIQYNLKLDCIVTQNGYRPAKLSEMLKEKVFLKPRKHLEFYIKNINKFENLKPFNIYWKVKNEEEVAKKYDKGTNISNR